MNNNAYDDGTGTVPLKDTAGNEVQPAASVGSYRVTNETPIGPPASLRAEAGDGRVRLVWTRPRRHFAIHQTTNFVMPQAPPCRWAQAWTGITSTRGLNRAVISWTLYIRAA